jgi:hypothetical protein
MRNLYFFIDCHDFKQTMSYIMRFIFTFDYKKPSGCLFKVMNWTPAFEAVS